MDLAAVMDQVGDALDTIDGLRVFRYPPDSLTPPAAVVDYPEDLTFDETYGRGQDRLTVPVILYVGRWTDRSSRDHLAAYCAGSGAESVKAAVEAFAYTECDTVRVTQAEFEPHTIGGVQYVAAIFELDVAGTGA